MKINKHLAILLSLAIGALMMLAAVAQSVPSLVNYQGKLTDASGNPLPSGTYGVTFRIWPNKAQLLGEQLIWGQDHNVAVINGIFNLILGAPGATNVPGAAVIDLGFAFNAPDRFIGLTVVRGTNGSAIPNPQELIPRQQFLSAPYAFRAVTAVTADRLFGGVSLDQLPPRTPTNNASLGGIAISLPVNTNRTLVAGESPVTARFPQFRVTLQTSGRPVNISLIPGANAPFQRSYLYMNRTGVTSPVDVGPELTAAIVRDSTRKATIFASPSPPALTSAYHGEFPPSTVHYIDFPEAGTHTYEIEVDLVGGAGTFIYFYNISLVAYEL